MSGLEASLLLGALHGLALAVVRAAGSGIGARINISPRCSARW
jgi:hypothetical protein